MLVVGVRFWIVIICWWWISSGICVVLSVVSVSLIWSWSLFVLVKMVVFIVRKIIIGGFLCSVVFVVIWVFWFWRW